MDNPPMKIPPVRVLFSEDDRREVLARLDEAMRTGFVAAGKNVKELESRFAEFVGRKHAVAVSSGGAAIEVTMRALGLEGGEVLVPTNTFAATATGVLMAGGQVRLVDADRRSFGVSLAQLKARVTEKTVGVAVVHVGGIVSDEMPAIRDWCASQGLWLFEDCAHAHGSSLEVDGTQIPAGGFGRVAGWSFFATKVMTSGEGGMITTDDDGLAERARGIRDYGKSDPWVSYHTELGGNGRMPEPCAAMGCVQLARLPEFLDSRADAAKAYQAALRDWPQLEPVWPPAGRCSWYKLIVLLPAGLDRAAVKAACKARGVSLAGGVYELPLHAQPLFERLLGEAGDAFPMADEICARHVCLPIFPGLSGEEARYATRVLGEVVGAALEEK